MVSGAKVKLDILVKKASPHPPKKHQHQREKLGLAKIFELHKISQRLQCLSKSCLVRFDQDQPGGLQNFVVALFVDGVVDGGGRLDVQRMVRLKL